MKIVDLSGQKFGRLTVLSFSHMAGKSHWLCRCDCGNEKVINVGNLKSGRSLSCGCLQKERASKARGSHRMCKHPMYRTWSSMKQRCTNEDHNDYKWYGARGIKLCARWHDFIAFKSDMEATWKPSLTIERIDVYGDYEPSNCCWKTMKEQLRNTRRTVFVDTPWGRICAAEASERSGIAYTEVLAMAKSGEAIGG